MALRLCVFDFDCTLSSKHVFSLLASGDGIVPPPYASTERGQMARISELDKLPKFAAAGGFAHAAFGGEQRVRQLQAFFQELNAAGVECMVASRGLVGPIRKCLDQVGILQHFSQIYAKIGDAYGALDYDKESSWDGSGDTRYLGDSGNTGWSSKGDLVRKLLQDRGLGADEALFVDDTAAEISSVRGACRVLPIRLAKGMASEHLARVRSMLGSSQAQVPVTPKGVMVLPTAETKHEEPLLVKGKMEPVVKGDAQEDQNSSSNLANRGMWFLLFVALAMHHA